MNVNKRRPRSSNKTLGRQSEQCSRNRTSEWVATFHPDRLACRLEGAFIHGAYNVCQKVDFSDGIVCDKHADEIVAMEAEVLRVIRENTTIPVPDIKAWGLAVDNSPGLGPFYYYDFRRGW